MTERTRPTGTAVRRVLGPMACGLVVVALLAAVGTWPSTRSASAVPTATIALSQSTGLVDGQTVTVTGTGFPASTQVAVIECRTTATTQSGCAMPTIGYVMTDLDGSFSTPITLLSTIYPADGPTDCSVAGSCHVGAGVVPSGEVSAVAAFEIAPGPVPSLTIAPSTNLSDGTTISVTGSGYPRGAWLAMIECRNGATGAPGCDMSTIVYLYADAQGGFTAMFAVHAIIHTDEGTFDCRITDACRFGAGVVPTGASASIDLPFADPTGIVGPGYTG